ncbi:PASTA domain-containing protein [Yinghuangia soli]|uniref:PASTA domain-containing protein n=1 Tax=Yinghuangia soli TaxID=2908204 RepID=A0AA41PYP4_9ACTN|nr:PASTA domain-containing protein [Yinghuangia soli]MCF2528353.1 PASTA domain-containing protein [Yinghuangia soli]
MRRGVVFAGIFFGLLIPMALVLAALGYGVRGPAKERVPDVVGLRLDRAKRVLDQAGFPLTGSHDLLERESEQAFERRWKVCTQSPGAAKSVRAGTRVELGVVGLHQSCPE